MSVVCGVWWRWAEGRAAKLSLCTLRLPFYFAEFASADRVFWVKVAAKRLIRARQADRARRTTS